MHLWLILGDGVNKAADLARQIRILEIGSMQIG